MGEHYARTITGELIGPYDTVAECDANLEDANKESMWDKLIELGVSEETLKIVTSINGYSDSTMRDVLYAATGYRDFDQLDAE